MMTTNTDPNSEKENIYYIYQEEKEPDTDQQSIEEDSNEDEQELTHSQNAFLMLLNIMFNPVQGWKNLRRSKLSVESLQSGCFYPILAVLALSNFSEYFYSVNVSLSSVVTKAVISFVSYFFGFFCVLIVLKILLPKNTLMNFEGEFGKNYIITGLSTLALFSILTNLLPMLWPVLIFLPLWTLYLLYKGSRFFKMAETQELRFLIVTCVAVIGVPLLIDWALNEILPY